MGEGSRDPFSTVGTYEVANTNLFGLVCGNLDEKNCSTESRTELGEQKSRKCEKGRQLLAKYPHNADYHSDYRKKTCNNNTSNHNEDTTPTLNNSDDTRSVPRASTPTNPTPIP